MPATARDAKRARARGASAAAAAAPSTPSVAPAPRETTASSRVAYRHVAAPRPFPAGSRLVGLAHERPRFLELPWFGEGRRSVQQRSAIGLVRQIADAGKIPGQKCRPFGDHPAELVERDIHVAHTTYVL